MGPDIALVLQTSGAEVDEQPPFMSVSFEVVQNLSCFHVSKFAQGLEFENH